MNGLTIAPANSMLRQCNAVDTILLFYLFSLRFACLYKITNSIMQCNHCKRVNNKFNKSYDLPLDLLQYRRENSAEYLYS